MPELAWDKFEALSGSPNDNFEDLWRVLVRRHYGQHGEFRELAQQPGVEFHLRLHSECCLGEPERWYGWQCRWYEIGPGRALGSARRAGILDALAKSQRYVPGLTDWVLCTRHALTRGDQEWFFGISHPARLHIWTAVQLEEHLHGPGEIFRKTYFGDLIFSFDWLRDLHASSVASIQHVFCAEVHQRIEAGRQLEAMLGTIEMRANLSGIARQLEREIGRVTSQNDGNGGSAHAECVRFLSSARRQHKALVDTHNGLEGGRFEQLRHQLVAQESPDSEVHDFARRQRAERRSSAPYVANVVAGLTASYNAQCAVRQALECQLVAVVGEAGYGKTELAVQLTAASGDRPAGVLLHGRDLGARQSLDELARRVLVYGEAVESFSALVAGVDSAGRRARRRLAIVIDGLNEAEDPRDWKRLLAGHAVLLEQHPYVLVVCTLRNDDVDDALPPGVRQLKCRGFGPDLRAAVERYFAYYRIDGSDGVVHLRFLDHPLTLRIFCEVTNPNRSETVGAEAMPGSLGELFDRYLKRAANRLSELSSISMRYREEDVREALERIGTALWHNRKRSISVGVLRQSLGDDGRLWEDSIVRALEQNGVLTRYQGRDAAEDESAVVYDALAGHMVAAALLAELRRDGREFGEWFVESKTNERFFGDIKARHPLYHDTLVGLASLLPRTTGGRQLWQFLSGRSRIEALREAARLERKYVDGGTVREIGRIIRGRVDGSHELFAVLRTLRSALEHPLNGEFLDRTLRSMDAGDRDLVWTEWIRASTGGLYEDVGRLETRWQRSDERGVRDRLRAIWVMWLLTTTDRQLRDRATRALYWFGRLAPETLFSLSVGSLEINDQYVPERVLAAAYGVGMRLGTGSEGEDARDVVVTAAAALGARVLGRDGHAGVAHLLTRHYARGFAELAEMLKSGAEGVQDGGPSEGDSPCVFREADTITKEDTAEAVNAISLDFGNYTLGRLVHDRQNYDFEHPAYQIVRRQIEARIVDLGYAASRFSVIDSYIGKDAWRQDEATKIERYGKKYAWVAYFEMYSGRRSKGLLSDSWSDDPPPEVNIDPSFPGPVQQWSPWLRDVFTDAPTEATEWASCGIAPEYDHLLFAPTVDSQSGPWLLLDGYMSEEAPRDDRRIFSFLRSVLVAEDKLSAVCSKLDALDYPGNDAIPELATDTYTYSGEVPWSSRFGRKLRDESGRAVRDLRSAFTQWGTGEVGEEVEIPVYECEWESYHSKMNPGRDIVVPAPALCSALELKSGQGDGDLHDRRGKIASLYRECADVEAGAKGHLAYIRADLLSTYLKSTAQVLVWFVWGERCLRQGPFPLGGTNQQIHTRCRVFRPGGNRRIERWMGSKRLKDRGPGTGGTGEG